MWNASDDLISAVFEEDDSSDSEDGSLAEEDEEQCNDPDFLPENLDYESLPMFYEDENKTLVPFPPALQAENLSDDDEDYVASCALPDVPNPISASNSPRFRLEVLDEDMEAPEAEPGPSSLGQAAGRGGSAGRGRSRGSRGGRRGLSARGSGRGRGLRARGDGWMVGQPLQERYVSDADLPEDLQVCIRRVLLSRSRKRRPNVPGQQQGVRVCVSEDPEEDVFYDAQEELVWRGTEEWSPSKEEFTPPRPVGPTIRFDNGYDALRAIWDEQIMSHIVTETNRHAETISSASFQHDWYATNEHELWTLFAFWMMLGIIKMPSIKSCFTKLSLLETKVFRSLMGESRYWNLNRAFHLAEGTNREDLLHPMGSLLDHLNDKFKSLYQMGPEICIDESLTLWKGPAQMKQYIKTKSAQWGIKSYQLHESSTGYMWSFFIYLGQKYEQQSSNRLPVVVNTVLRLIKPVLNLGHVLYMDNWFNSPLLARFLKRQKTDCVGTVRPNRKSMPLEVQRAPLAEGQFIARCTDGVMAVAIHDHNRRVSLLSTCHDTTQVLKQAGPGCLPRYRLQLVEDYNRNMGGVDLMDQMLEPYLIERKQCLEWSRKLFKRLLNVSIQNARILVEKSQNKKLGALEFRLSLVQQIIEKHLPHIPKRLPKPRTIVRNSEFPPNRLTERHFIRRIPVTEEMREHIVHKRNLGRRKCVLCKSKGQRSTTAYECPKCEMALCFDWCFEEFHRVP